MLVKSDPVSDLSCIHVNRWLANIEWLYPMVMFQVCAVVLEFGLVGTYPYSGSSGSLQHLGLLDSTTRLTLLR